jgi:cell division protein FtsZ
MSIKSESTRHQELGKLTVWRRRSTWRDQQHDRSGLEGVDFVVANTDSQALMSSQAQRRIQMGVAVTEGLGAGSQPEIGRAAAEEAIHEITDHLAGAHMIFVTAGMGGGTGTGAAPVIARAAREHGVLTVGVVTKPFQFEGARRMRIAEAGIADLAENVDTVIVIPNQNLFRSPAGPFAAPSPWRTGALPASASPTSWSRKA